MTRPSARAPRGWLGGARFVLLLATVTLAFLLIVEPVRGAPAQTAARLPSPLHDISVVWDARDRPEWGCAGGCAYFLGGGNGSVASKQVLRFNPANGSVMNTNATLPAPRMSASAAFDGSSVYLFGGWNGSAQRLRTIVRYDIANGTATNLTTLLPKATERSAAIWDGRDRPSAGCGGGCAYIIGGGDGGAEKYKEILKFHPRSGNLTTAALLPGGLYAPSAVWDPRDRPSAGCGGGCAYIFGGQPDNTFTNATRQFNPDSGNVTTLEAKLPSPRRATSAVWTGHEALVFGGSTECCPGFPMEDFTNQTVLFQPSSNTTSVYTVSMPTDRALTSAFFDGRDAYVVGGCAYAEACATDRILIVPGPAPLPPAAPRNLKAATGPGRGEVALTWEAPVLSARPVTGYRVYHGTASGQLSFLQETAATAFTATGIPDGAIRYYVVSALNSVGEGNLSAEVTGRAPWEPGPPLRPTAFTGPGRGQIHLSWEPPEDAGGVTLLEYRVYRGNASGEESFLVAQSPTETTFLDTGLPDGAVRTYRIAGVNVVGEGNLSPGATGRAPWLPSPPRNPNAQPGQEIGQVRLAWEAPSDTGGVPILNYTVYRGGPGETLAPVTTLGNVTSFVDTTPSLVSVYFYEVAAHNVVGEGPASAAACSAPNPWTAALVPPLGPPCPPRPGWSERQLLAASTPSDETPPVQAEVLRLQAGPQAEDPSVYRVRLTAAGQSLPPLDFLIGGLQGPTLDVRAVDLQPQALPASAPVARVQAWERHDPSQVTCVIIVQNPNVGTLCPALPMTPYPPTWAVNDSPSSTLVVRVQLTDASGESLADHTLTAPAAGQVFAIVP